MTVLRSFAGAVFANPPLTPTDDEARNLLEAELRGAVYQEQPEPWYLRILERIIEFIENLSGTNMPPAVVLWIVLGVLVALAVVFVLAGPIRRARTTKRDKSLFETQTVTAAEYRDRAQQAAAQGDFSLASIEMFRAVVKRSEEEVVITENPGRTAYEASLAIGQSVPALKDSITWASSLFDLVEYGGESASAPDVARLEDLYVAIADHAGDAAQLVEVSL